MCGIGYIWSLYFERPRERRHEKRRKRRSETRSRHVTVGMGLLVAYVGPPSYSRPGSRLSRGMLQV